MRSGALPESSSPPPPIPPASAQRPRTCLPGGTAIRGPRAPKAKCPGLPRGAAGASPSGSQPQPPRDSPHTSCSAIARSPPTPMKAKAKAAAATRLPRATSGRPSLPFPRRARRGERRSPGRGDRSWLPWWGGGDVPEGLPSLRGPDKESGGRGSSLVAPARWRSPLFKGQPPPLRTPTASLDHVSGQGLVHAAQGCREPSARQRLGRLSSYRREGSAAGGGERPQLGGGGGRVTQPCPPSFLPCAPPEFGASPKLPFL